MVSLSLRTIIGLSIGTAFNNPCTKRKIALAWDLSTASTPIVAISPAAKYSS